MNKHPAARKILLQVRRHHTVAKAKAKAKVMCWPNDHVVVIVVLCRETERVFGLTYTIFKDVHVKPLSMLEKEQSRLNHLFEGKITLSTKGGYTEIIDGPNPSPGQIERVIERALQEPPMHCTSRCRKVGWRLE